MLRRPVACHEHVHDILQIFVECLFCDWQSELVFCDNVSVSSFFAFTPAKCKSEYMIRCRHMQYLIRFSDLLFAFQDQENIIVPVMFSWGEK